MEREGQIAFDRCLLLVPRGYDAPLDLLDGLRRWGVAVREVSDEPSVMVALAREATASLVIVEPAQHQDLGVLTGAVNRYHTGTVIWRYERSSTPRLARCAPHFIAPAEASVRSESPQRNPLMPEVPPLAAPPESRDIPAEPVATLAELPAESVVTAEPSEWTEQSSPPVPSASGLIMDSPPAIVAEPQDELEVLPPDDDAPLTTPNFSPVTLTDAEIAMLLDDGPAQRAQR